MKKKLLAMAMASAMVLSLAACGSSGDDASSADGTAENTEQASNEGKESNLNVGVFYYTYSDPYITSVRSALDTQLKDAGIKFQNYDGNNNQTTQNEQIDTAISQGCNLLVVNIVTSGSADAATQVIDKAKAADIPVIFFNRAVEGENDEEGVVLGSYEKCAFVGTDAPEAGHLQGEMIGNYLMENFDTVDLNGDGKISYAMFMGQLGNVEAIYRTQYAVEDANKILEENGKPALEFFDPSNTDKYQVDQDGAWSSAASNNYMSTNLSQFNEANGNMIEIVICNNDGMAEGAISALNDKGYNLGTEESTMIPVFGVDATDAAKQLISDGKMTGTIKQDADGMAETLAMLTQNAGDGKALMDGMDSVETINISETVSNKIFIPYGMYTGEE